jgi:hypothetical protein
VSDNPFGPVMQQLGQMIGEHRNGPEAGRAEGRLVYGTIIFAACIYAFLWTPVYFGGDAPQAVMNNHSWLAIAWLALVALSLLWIVVGFRGPSLPRSGMKIFWSVVRLVLLACAFHFKWWPPVEWGPQHMMVVIDITIRGFYVAFFWGGIAELITLLRGPKGGAQEALMRDLDRRQNPFRSARR